MALSKTNAQKVITGFGKIFPEQKASIKKEGKKSDGGFEAISIVVPKIRSVQFADFRDLSKEVGNSLVMEPVDGQIQITFF